MRVALAAVMVAAVMFPTVRVTMLAAVTAAE